MSLIPKNKQNSDMNLENIILSEISQRQKDKYDATYMNSYTMADSWRQSGWGVRYCLMGTDSAQEDGKVLVMGNSSTL